MREVLDDRLEGVVAGEGNEEDLGGCDGWGEGENAARLIGTFGGAGPVGVLEQGVENASDTEGGLDDVGGVLSRVLGAGAFLDHQEILCDLDGAVSNAWDFESDLAVLAQVLGQRLALFLRGGGKGGLDGLAVLLVEGTKLFLVNLGSELLDDEGLSELFAHDERSTSLLGMDSEIVCASVGAAYTLHPTVAGEQLSIPAVGRVMRHLVSHVLAKPDFRLVDAKLLQEKLDAGQKVTEGLVIDDAIGNGLANSYGLDVGLARQLGSSVEKDKLNILDLCETRMLLAAERIDVMLDFGHQELADTEQTSAWGDFVSERFANGCGGKGHLLLVELEEFGKVEELTLGSFWAEVARGVGAGADARLEHEVECYRWFGHDASIWVLHLVCFNELAKFFAIVVVNLCMLAMFIVTPFQPYLCQDLLVLLRLGIIKFDGLGILDLALLL